MWSAKKFFFEGLHIFSLVGFAVAQPLFDLLSKYTEFFIAHHSKPLDMGLFIVCLCLAIPLLIMVVRLLILPLGPKIGQAVYAFIFTGLTAAIFLQVLNKVISLPGVVLLILSAGLGIGATLLYIRFQTLRRYFSALALVALIFPVLFVFNPAVRKTIISDPYPAVKAVNKENLPPIIMVVFDEFPLSSLMDSEFKIDPVRYPNFAKLSENAHWFRNYTTVAERTSNALPSILCGVYPEPGLLPTTIDYPKSLFTLLGALYDVHAYEPDSMLCPDEICRERIGALGLRQRMAALFWDSAMVYGNLLLPPDLRKYLPTVSLTWKNFSDQGLSPNNNAQMGSAGWGQNRAGLFTQFVNSISLSEKPALHFFHSRLPHLPWQYLPSGKTFNYRGLTRQGLNINEDKWGPDQWPITQAYQRHLLQIGFMDKLLGNLVTKLKTVNLYDRAVIVITADHGLSFGINQFRRKVDPNQPTNIMSVPLFIKIPHQKKGLTTDRNVESIDILPTLAAILDIQLPWPVKGDSMLDTALSERQQKTIYDHRTQKRLFKDSKDFWHAALKEKLTFFGSGNGINGLYAIGPYRQLIGEPIDRFSNRGVSEAEVTFEQSSLYDQVDPDSAFLPVNISGKVYRKTGLESPLYLAIAANGVIAATTQPYQNKVQKAFFSALIPETMLKRGKNQIDLFLITEQNGVLQLNSCRQKTAPAYSLKKTTNREEVLSINEGESIAIVKGSLKGCIDMADVRGDRIIFEGWAADVTNSRRPEAIAVFLNGEYLFTGDTGIDRPDVAKYFDKPTLKNTGFSLSMPLSHIEKLKHPKIRLFAISGKQSSELTYPRNYKW